MTSRHDEGKLMVRPIEPGDARTVSTLVGQLGYTRSEQEIRDWIAAADASRQAALVACYGGEVAGWIEVSIERHLQSAPLALIGGLVVAEGLRGKGIGRELCRAAEAWAWKHAVEKVRVTSRSTRIDAHRFYTRDGYGVVKTSLIFEKDRPKQA